MGALSRRKGASFELRCAARILDRLGVDLERGRVGAPQSGRYGDLVPVSPGVAWPFHTECRKREGWSLDQVAQWQGLVVTWWRQAEQETPPGCHPLLLVSRNRQPVWMLTSEQGYRYLDAFHGLDLHRRTALRSPGAPMAVVL